MLTIPPTPEMLYVARRMVWFQKPEEAIRHPYTFMAHVMTYGTVEDILLVKKQLGMAAFKTTIDHMPPGIIDRKSWVYWNLMIGRTTPPPRPKRRFP